MTSTPSRSRSAKRSPNRRSPRRDRSPSRQPERSLRTGDKNQKVKSKGSGAVLNRRSAGDPGTHTCADCGRTIQDNPASVDQRRRSVYCRTARLANRGFAKGDWWACRRRVDEEISWEKLEWDRALREKRQPRSPSQTPPRKPNRRSDSRPPRSRPRAHHRERSERPRSSRDVEEKPKERRDRGRSPRSAAPEGRKKVEKREVSTSKPSQAKNPKGLKLKETAHPPNEKESESESYEYYSEESGSGEPQEPAKVVEKAPRKTEAAAVQSAHSTGKEQPAEVIAPSREDRRHALYVDCLRTALANIGS